MPTPSSQGLPKHCPLHGVLKDFTTGRLPEMVSEAIAKHIDHCPRCAESLLDLEYEYDPLIEELQHVDVKVPPECKPGEIERVAGGNASFGSALHLDFSYQSIPELEGDSEQLSPPSASSPPLECPFCQAIQKEAFPASSGRHVCTKCGKPFLYLSSPHRITQKTSISHFEILECLGEGSYGIVWKAKDLLLDRFVALKIPRIHSENQKELFVREGRSAAQLRHPNIVQVYEVGTDDRTVYLASEYIEGKTLKEMLQERRLSFESSARMALTLAETLEVAHAKGIIHRDLTPANILIDQHGHPHIADFGIAKNRIVEPRFSSEGKMIGTPKYMSPEQTHGVRSEQDSGSDVYSLGVILFEMLTGRTPFQGDLPDLIHQILFDDPHPPSRYTADVPRPLDEICLKCLEKDPADRFASAAEFAGALKTYLDEPSPRDVAFEPKSPRLKRRYAVLMVLLFMLLPVSYGIAWWMLSRNDPTPSVSLSPKNVAKPRDYGSVEIVEKEANPSFSVEYVETIPVSSEGIASMDFSPDGEILATVGPVSECCWWDSRTGKRLMVLPRFETGYRGKIDFSRNGRFFAVGCYGLAVLFESPSGRVFTVLAGHESGVYLTRFSHDDRYLLTKPINSPPQLWSLKTESMVQDYLIIPTRARGLTFSPDDRQLLSFLLNQVDLWSTFRGEHLYSFPHPAPVQEAIFHPGGHRILSYTVNGEIFLWDSVSRVCQARHKFENGPATAVAFLPEGHSFGVGFADGTFAVCDSDQLETTLLAREHSGRISRVAFHPEGDLAVTVSLDRTAVLWDLNRKAPLATLRAHGEAVRHAVFSPDGTRLVTGSSDGVARLWKIRWKR